MITYGTHKLFYKIYTGFKVNKMITIKYDMITDNQSTKFIVRDIQICVLMPAVKINYNFFKIYSFYRL